MIKSSIRKKKIEKMMMKIKKKIKKQSERLLQIYDKTPLRSTALS